MAWLIFGLGVVCLFLALHPFLTYPLSLLVLRRVHHRPLRQPETPAAESFAVCVCAYNEEGVIREKAENLLAVKRSIPGLEVFVYVDAASDGTAAILREFEDQFTVHVSPERHGKTYGMNLLVAKATASIVIFTDANVMLDVETLPLLRRYFADPEVGCVCGHLIYTNARDSVTAATGSLYWRLEEKIKQLESETGSLMGADGSIFAIRRRLHHPPPDNIIDDMFVSFNILCDGYRIVRAPEVKAYEDSVTSPKEEFRRKVRIACQAFNVHKLLWKRLRRLGPLDLYKYISHKLLRWMALYTLALAVLLIEAAIVLAGQPVAALVLAILGAIGLWVGRTFQVTPLSQIWDILTAFAGTGLGVWRSLRGEKFQTWTPAASIRKRPNVAA